jgi:outer membrane receptor protein involved in Fe transport
VVKAGFTAKRLRARYDYMGSAIIRASLLHFNYGEQSIARSANLNTDGNDLAVYVADRAAITPHLVLEAGVRADAQSYAPHGTHVAPRVNASFALGEHVTLRASWGRFYQAQGLNELQVEDGVTTFFPAERADHALLGAEYDFGRGYSARAEVYDKRFTQVRPRYENIFDRTVIYPELHADRFRIDAARGSARGGELLLRKTGTRLSGWISLGRASAHDVLNDGAVSIEVPRAWDQRNTATFNVDYRLGAKWNFDVAGVYHSGWPTTPVVGLVVDGVFHTALGPYNSERLSAYRRMDVRASHNIEISNGGLSFFVELFNVLGIRNVTSVNGYNFTGDGKGNIIASKRLTKAALGVIPSFGVTYSF